MSFKWRSTKFSEAPFQEKMSTTASRLDDLVKFVIYCYPRHVVGEFPLVSNRIKLRAQMECQKIIMMSIR